MLFILLFLLFGKENISRLMQENISISEAENYPENVKAPGSQVNFFGSNRSLRIALYPFVGLVQVCLELSIFIIQA